MRKAAEGIVWAAAGLLLGGCGPSVPEEELGRIVNEVPEIPPGYDAYELPDLSVPGGESPEEGLPERGDGQTSEGV